MSGRFSPPPPPCSSSGIPMPDGMTGGTERNTPFSQAPCGQTNAMPFQTTNAAYRHPSIVLSPNSHQGGGASGLAHLLGSLSPSFSPEPAGSSTPSCSPQRAYPFSCAPSSTHNNNNSSNNDTTQSTAYVATNGLQRTVVPINGGNHVPIWDPRYCPPVQLRLTTISSALLSADAYTDAMQKVKAHERIRAVDRMRELASIKEKLAVLKASQAAVQHTARTDTACNIDKEAGVPPKEQTPFEMFGSPIVVFDPLPTEASPSATQPSLTASEEHDDSRPPEFAVENAFKAGVGPFAMPSQDGVTSPVSTGIGSGIPSSTTSDAPGPMRQIPSASPSLSSLPRMPGVSVTPATDAYETNAAEWTVECLVDTTKDLTSLAGKCVVSIRGMLSQSEKVLGLISEEFKARSTITWEEACGSGVYGPHTRAPVELVGAGTISSDARGEIPSASPSLSFISQRLSLMSRISDEITLAGINESRQRAAIGQEYNMFYAWAVQSEPTWREAVQRVVDERLAKEAAAAAEEERRQNLERMRKLALEAMANEQATAEARRAEEVARLRAEELAIARRMREARDAEVARAEALQIRRQQEERDKKDEEYSRLLQAEEELTHKLALQREAEEAARRLKQQQDDEAYAKMLQEEEELSEKLRCEEEALKARLEAAERQRQCEGDEKHARLLAAEDEIRMAIEAKQNALAKEKAGKEAMLRQAEEERIQKREEMIIAARLEEERLKLAQLEAAIARGRAESAASLGIGAVQQQQQQQQQYPYGVAPTSHPFAQNSAATGFYPYPVQPYPHPMHSPQSQSSMYGQAPPSPQQYQYGQSSVYSNTQSLYNGPAKYMGPHSGFSNNAMPPAHPTQQPPPQHTQQQAYYASPPYGSAHSVHPTYSQQYQPIPVAGPAATSSVPYSAQPSVNRHQQFDPSHFTALH